MAPFHLIVFSMRLTFVHLLLTSPTGIRWSAPSSSSFSDKCRRKGVEMEWESIEGGGVRRRAMVAPAAAVGSSGSR